MIINDIRGEDEVLENRNTVWPRVNIDAALSAGPPNEMNRVSGSELSGNTTFHCSNVTPGVVRQVRFSCPLGHTDTAIGR